MVGGGALGDIGGRGDNPTACDNQDSKVFKIKFLLVYCPKLFLNLSLYDVSIILEILSYDMVTLFQFCFGLVSGVV